LNAGCSFNVLPANATAAPTEVGFITATLAPTATPRASATPILPSATPTVAPVTGTTTAQVNVRAGPGTSEAVLGRIEAGQSVQVVGQDADGKWYLIQYDKSTTGTGWVAGQYVSVSGEVKVPVIGAPATPTTNATTVPQGPTGILQIKVNVRSGPGTNFNALGLLDANETVTLTGKNETGTWLQIIYAAGPEGHGWVSAAYVQVTDTSGLPVLNEYGTPVVEQSTTPGPTPTATTLPAAADGDSFSAPAAVARFVAGGASLFTFTSDVSAPQGDTEDWVAVQPAATGNFSFSLACTGNGALGVELWQGDAALSNWGKLVCGDQGVALSLTGGQAYLVRLFPISTNDGLKYVQYVLTIKMAP